jgi:hypothetical protein
MAAKSQCGFEIQPTNGLFTIQDDQQQRTWMLIALISAASHNCGDLIWATREKVSALLQKLHEIIRG